ncbi:hypothetical protein [Nakamurella sp. PAMC28650]|uniref:hypothetical protein n=1 Tax=Nakamurella sp. PAMC28650 TaxID=2762325 RepID=UPI00164E7C35|nr:hypothetical protein [Nakamurella sp. PAMC28650]QNK82168.1 hypothetical protein H7F38_05305 [Nakamurella sp. PAMC28650]
MAATPMLRSQVNSATTTGSTSPSGPRPCPALSTRAATNAVTSPQRCGRPNSANNRACNAFTYANNRSAVITASTRSEGDNAAGSTAANTANDPTPGRPAAATATAEPPPATRTTTAHTPQQSSNSPNICTG